MIPLSLTLDPSSLPTIPGPPGRVRQLLSRRFAPEAIGSQLFVPSAVAIPVETTGGDVLVRISGIVGHTVAGAIVWFSLYRDGVLLHADGMTGLTAARVNAPLEIEPFSIECLDPGVQAGEHVYTLAWRQSAGDSSARAWLGRRGADTQILSETAMTLVEL